MQKYQWVDQGSSYLIAESLSAILLGQLDNFEKIQGARRKIFERYLGIVSQKMNVSTNISALDVAHMFYFEFNDFVELNKFRIAMQKSGISVVTHYQPLHKSTFGSKFKNRIRDNSISEQVSKSLIRLPLWYQLTTADIDEVVMTAKEILGVES